jgi:hypothetical protein
LKELQADAGGKADDGAICQAADNTCECTFHPAMAIIALAVIMASEFESKRCRPATPTS